MIRAFETKLERSRCSLGDFDCIFELLRSCFILIREIPRSILTRQPCQPGWASISGSHLQSKRTSSLDESTLELIQQPCLICCSHPIQQSCVRVLSYVLTSSCYMYLIFGCFFFRESVYTQVQKLKRKGKNWRKKQNKANGTKSGALRTADSRERAQLNDLIDEYKHRQGVAYTYEENVQALLAYWRYKTTCLDIKAPLYRPSEDHVIEHVSRSLCRGKENVRRLVEHFNTHGVVLFYPTENRGRGSKQWVCCSFPYCSKSKFNLFESNGDGLPFLMMTGSLFCVFLLLFHLFHLLLNLFYAQDICAGRYASLSLHLDRAAHVEAAQSQATQTSEHSDDVL